MKKRKKTSILLVYFFTLMLLLNLGCSNGSSDSDSLSRGSATGLWEYHSEADLTAITINWTDADFSCNGPILGYDTVRMTITATTMTWENMTWNGDITADDIIWTRDTGIEGDPVGKWTATVEGGGKYELEIIEDGRISISASDLPCVDEGT
jgi:hypothetical protein